MDRLRYFSAIASSGSFRAAADQLRLSPAALSKAMKLLEEELGVELFTQVGRGIALTQHGKWFVSRAESLLRTQAEIRETIRALGVDQSKTLRLGSFEVFTTHFLNALTPSFADLDFSLHELTPGTLETAIAENKIDLGITYLPIPHPEVIATRVARAQMGIFGHSKFHNGSGSGEAFSSLPFVIPIHPLQGTPSRVNGLDGWPEARYPRKVKYRVTLMESALALCRKGFAVAYLPKFVVELHNQDVRSELRLHEIPRPRSMQDSDPAVFILRNRAQPEDAAMKKLASVIRRTIK